MSHFYSKKIAIDISIYMYRYKSENQLIEKIYLLCCIMDYYKITPIFVFDGKPPEEKKDTIINRKVERNTAKGTLNTIINTLEKNNIDLDTYEKKYKKKIENLRRKSIKLSQNEFNKTKQLIEAFGMTYIVADSEAETLCAELLMKKQVDYCLSEDTDMFAYLSPYILRYISLSNHKMLLYDLKKILINLNLTKKEFLNICILSGNDYYNGNKNIYYYYKMMMKYKKLCLYNEISFIDWLKRKNIINAHLINEFNNNIKMYHLKCDKKEIKITKNRKQMDVIYSILEEEHFIFP